jgi:hypothetical protein
MDERRIAAMVECLVNDPSAARRPFHSMNAKFMSAPDDEFVEAFDRTVLLLREMIRQDQEWITPKHEPEVMRRRKSAAKPEPLPLFPTAQVSREPGPGFLPPRSSKSPRRGSRKPR